MNGRDAARLGIEAMETVRLISRRGEAEAVCLPTERVGPGSVFTPFHFAWGANKLSLGLLDPHSRQPAFKQCAVRIEKTR